MNYTELLIQAEESGLIVKEKPLRSSRGRIQGNRIAIRGGLSDAEKACVLAEEIGHFETAVGDILEQDTVQNRKAEQAGRLYAYNRMIGLEGIIRAYRRHCCDRAEMAEYLEVTEEFLQEALECYRRKYGVSCRIDHYVIFFEPSLAVMKVL